jgi:integrase
MNALTLERQDNGLGYLESIKDSYRGAAKTWLAYAREHGGVSIPAMRRYFQWLETQGYKASTVRIKRAAAIDRVRRLAALPGATTPEQRDKLEWAIKEVNKDNRAPKIQFSSVGVEKVLTLDEYYKTMNACGSERQRLFLCFLYSTWARVAEMRGIRLADCKAVLGTVYFSVLGKGKKERTLRIGENIFNAIREVFKGQVYLFETSRGKPYACQYISGEIRKVTEKAIGRPLSAHKMRHSFATRQLAHGVPVDALSRYLGHSDTSITLKYYSHNEMTNSQLFIDELYKARA